MDSIAEPDPRIEAVARAAYNYNYYSKDWADEAPSDQLLLTRYESDRDLYRADAVRMLAAADSVDDARHRLAAAEHQARTYKSAWDQLSAHIDTAAEALQIAKT